jgi:tetratricopeptide (TPR) repeat protein
MNARRVVLPVLLLASLVFTSSAAAQQQDALELYRTGRFQEAVDACLLELKEAPNRMDAYAVLTWSLLRMKRYAEALDYSRKAMSISRYDPRMIESAGEALYFLGRGQEALTYFSEYAAMVSTGGRVDSVYYYMGEIFIQMGRFNSADIALSTALYHSPNSAAWWARLGYAREKAQDYRWALDAYDKALKLNPGLVDAVRGRSRVQQLSSGG